MGRAYAGILGSLAFATIICRAILTGGSTESALGLASYSTFAFASIGWLAGTIAEQTLNEAVRLRFEKEMKASEKENVERAQRASATAART